MRFALGLALVAAVSAVYSPLSINAVGSSDIIEGEYIVVLNSDVKLDTHMSLMSSLVNETNTMHTYSIGDFQGYAAKMSKAEAKSLAAHRDVKYIEPNMVARALQTCNSYAAPHSWGLARTVRVGAVTQPGLPPIAQAPYELSSAATGQGIELHIIDTGVYCLNNDFQGRAGATCQMVFDATNEGMFDGNGHGTHVASTAGGLRFGLAKNANIFGIKVLGSNGSGTFAGVISGINFSADAARGGVRRIVGNMSLGGGRNQAVNDATDNSFRAGLVMVVAAGNSNNNACNSSPASADLAFTVMSTDSTDARSTFSSFGPCCNVFAPGTGITAAWIGAPERTNTISGTSMAAPHVAGIAAKIWSRNNMLNNGGVQDALIRMSAPNRGLIRNGGAGSPDHFALHTCASA
jgi:subtilisin family serine protease